MTLLLDAGALVAIDRDDRDMQTVVQLAVQQRLKLRTSAIVVAEVWRDPRGRQARLARLLRAVDVRPVDVQTGQRAGVLLGRARLNDPVDAVLVVLAEDDDTILTSDVDDITRLVAAAGKRVGVVAV